MPSVIVKSLIVGALAYLAKFLYIYRNRAFGTSKRKDPDFKDISGWPLIGQVPELITNMSYSLEWGANNLFKLGAGHSITVPGVRIIDINRPEWIEYVQKTNFDNYIKGSVLHSIIADVFGDGIFATDGEVWKRTRHATSTIFSVNSFKTIMVPSVHKNLDSLIEAMSSKVGAEEGLDLSHVFFSFTLDTFVHMTFGKDLNLVNDGFKGTNYQKKHDSYPTPASSFADAFDYAQNHLDFRFPMFNVWKLLEKINFRLGMRMNSACNTLNEYAYTLIDERLENPPERKVTGESEMLRRDLLGLFMSARDERGGKLGRTELRDAVINLIIAGRDTTAQALSWTFYHILMNKDIVTKLRKEAKDIMGDDKGERVEYINYKRFVWTQAVVLEALRLHPSVPKNGKFAVNADKIPGGPTIEPGDAVRWSDWAMGRDPELWGPDCGEYRPQRWIEDSGKIKQFGQFKFHAFNGGPRACLGMNLAIFEAVSVIVEVLNKFDLEFIPGWLEQVPKSMPICGISSTYPTPSYRASLTMPMEKPLMVSIKLRES